MTPKNKPSQTQQHMRDHADIRSIMERARATGQRPVPSSPLFYGDFTKVGSYHESMNQLVKAQQAFMTLPSRVRERFQNDPGKLIEFLGDEKNRDEAVQLGIIEEKVVKQPDVVVEKEVKKTTKSKTTEPEE